MRSPDSLPDPMALVGSKPTTTPNHSEPRTMYKLGEEPTKVYSVDAGSWMALGWSYEEPVTPAAETVEASTAEVQEQPKSKRGIFKTE